MQQQTSLAFADAPLPAPSRSSRAKGAPACAQLSLRKATGAVHISNDITTLQRKVLNALLCTAGSQLGDRTILSHQVALRYLCQLTGFNSHNVQHIKDSIESLVATRIRWDIIHPDGDDEWGVAALLADAVIRGGVVTYSFAPRLREKLATPERWASLRMPVIRQFTSAPALAMYENCIPYRGVGQTPFFPLMLLRELLGATAESYNEFKALNRSILKPALAEVNKVGRENQDIQVELEYKRVKRQVTEVKLWITSPEDGATEADLAVDERLLEQLTADFCLAPKKAHQILLDIEAETVVAVMNYVGGRYAKGQIERGKIAPYFLSTLTRWEGEEAKESRLDQTPAQAAGTAPGKGFGATREKELKAAARRKEEARAAEARRAEALRRLSALSVEQRVDFDQRFETSVAKEAPFLLNVLKANGSDHPMIKGMYHIFVERELLDATPA